MPFVNEMSWGTLDALRNDDWKRLIIPPASYSLILWYFKVLYIFEMILCLYFVKSLAILCAW
jgi:hypothetical protein